MDDYISRGDAIVVVQYNPDPVEGIKQLPAADLADVVRCEECVYKRVTGDSPFKVYTCALAEGLNICKADTFCSYGERNARYSR